MRYLGQGRGTLVNKTNIPVSSSETYFLAVKSRKQITHICYKVRSIECYRKEGKRVGGSGTHRRKVVGEVCGSEKLGRQLLRKELKEDRN